MKMNWHRAALLSQRRPEPLIRLVSLKMFSRCSPNQGRFEAKYGTSDMSMVQLISAVCWIFGGTTVTLEDDPTRMCAT